MNMIGTYDDSDMKIADGKKKSVEQQYDGESVNFYEEQTENGNLAKAQRVGATLAENVDRLIFEQPKLSECTAGLPVQKKLLMIFGFVAGIEEFTPNKLLIRTCLNVFYDTLKRESPAIYESMGLTGAFSFFYLEYRRKGDSAQNIANAFAMLCGADGNDEYIALGSKIFGEYFSFVEKLTEEVGYVR